MSYLLKLVILHSKSEATCHFISQNMFCLVVWDPVNTYDHWSLVPIIQNKDGQEKESETNNRFYTYF